MTTAASSGHAAHSSPRTAMASLSSKEEQDDTEDPLARYQWPQFARRRRRRVDDEPALAGDTTSPRAEKASRSDTSSPSSARTLPEVTYSDDSESAVDDDGTASGSSSSTSSEADEQRLLRDARISRAADAPAEWHRLIELVPPPHQYFLTGGMSSLSLCDCWAPPPLLRTLSMSCQETGQHAMVTTVAARFLSHNPALTCHVPWHIVCSGYSRNPMLLAMPPTLLLYAESSDLAQLAHGAVSQRAAAAGVCVCQTTTLMPPGLRAPRSFSRARARAQARLAAFADHLRAQQKAAIATAGGGLCIVILPPPPNSSGSIELAAVLVCLDHRGASSSSSQRSWAKPRPQALCVRWAAETAASPPDSTSNAASIHSIEHPLEPPDQL